MKIICKITLLLILATSTNYAQITKKLSGNKPVIQNMLSDEDILKIYLRNFFNAVRSDNYSVVKDYVSDEIRRKYFNSNTGVNNTTDKIISYSLPKSFQIDSIKISVSIDEGYAEFIINDNNRYKNRREALSFVKKGGKWLITGSNSFLDIILNKVTKDKIVQNEAIINSGMINQSLSQKGIIRRHTLFTPEDLNILTINGAVTRQYISNFLFHTPGDGKIVLLDGSTLGNPKPFCVISDNALSRLIYAREKGLNSWTKSYGENQGEHEILAPDCLSLDKYGNIYVLDIIKGKILKLFYNDTDETISYVSTLYTPDIKYPQHFCLEYNSPGNNSYNIWVTSQFQPGLFLLDQNGDFLGQFWYILNTEGEKLCFEHPSEVLSFKYLGAKYLAVIDKNRKRIIIIKTITGYQSGGILCQNYCAYEFSEDLNVDLNSLSTPFVNSGLYVCDKNNKMFHIFNPEDLQYTGSIQKDVSGLNQWVKPEFISSGSMSYSDFYYLAFTTMDYWDSNTGINTYLPGADMVNTSVLYNDEPDNTYAAIHTTFIGDPLVNVSLYSYDGSSHFVRLIETNLRTYSKNWCEIIPSWYVQPLGKYYLQFDMVPSQNSEYGNYQQTNTGTVWFAMPLKSNLAGPKQGTTGSSLFWNVNPVSGSGDITCTWMKQDFGSSAIQTISTEKQLEFIMPNNSFTLICVVTDNFTKQTQTIIQFIRHITTSGSLTSEEE